MAMTNDVHATVTVEQTYPYEADERQRNKDFALSDWFSRALSSYLSHEGGKGDIIKLKTETSKGKIKLTGIVSNEALRRRVVEQAAVLKVASGQITSLDSSGVKAPEHTAGEPAPQRIPLTDGEIVDRVESLVEWHLPCRARRLSWSSPASTVWCLYRAAQTRRCCIDD